jgi:hypothetical protein
MRSTKVWVLAILFLAVLAGTVMWLGASSPGNAALAEGHDHWQHHDGHWSYWNEGDKRWYYTDGSHWFSNDGGDNDAWKVYRFDKDHKFGADFERGEYKVPEEGVKIEVPRHGVYHKK